MKTIEQLQEENEMLRGVIYEAYQMAGALNASEQALDNLLAAASGEPLSYETFLPHYSYEDLRAKENAELKAERDALAAQVEFFAKSFSELREHHVANFHLKNPFIGNLALHENWRLITHAISAENGVLHDLIYRAWVDGFEASSCCFNGEYSEDEKRPYVLAKCFADGVANKPSNSYQHHLREVRAEALQKAIHAVANKYDGSDTTNLWCIGANHVLVLFGKYADSIRQGGVE